MNIKVESFPEIMNDLNYFENKTKKLIDDLKSVCSNYGLGGDGNEYKVITQIFLYKFFNDKFLYEIKKNNNDLKNTKNIEEEIKKIKKKDLEILLLQLDENTARLKPENLISSIFEKLNEPNFAKIFDDNLINIANNNSDTFVVLTSEGQKVQLFEKISSYVRDKPNEFCKAIINKIVDFSFEEIFGERFDFFASIFEYLIKDYNSNSGGAYAEYFTPHSVSQIMANCLIDKNTSNVTCYDPSAGSGTLLLNLANKIGNNKCTIYSQDISQKSSQLLRLNLILNNLIHSLPNIIEGNTLANPFHKNKDNGLKKFDFIVSNPPFKLNFSDFREELDTKENKERFFAGIPNVPKKDKNKMQIFLVFLQHILHSLNDDGKAAIVIPTGFVSAKSGIEKKIKEYLIENKILTGVINMPRNIFAATQTNVSILFLDKKKTNDEVIFIDASELGETIKEGKNEKTVLSEKDEEFIYSTFKERKKIDEFSVITNYEKIKEKQYTFNIGRYMDFKIEYIDITEEEFQNKISQFRKNYKTLDSKSKDAETEMFEVLSKMELDNG